MFEKAKAVVMVGQGQVVLKEILLPEVTDESIVVKMKYSGISRGTEMRLYNGHVAQIGLTYPLIPGYEGVGEVVYVGDKVDGFKVGDRVMANEVYHYPEYTAAWGGNVEYAVIGPHTQGVPANEWAVPIPDEVSYEEAVIAYLASVSLKGCERIPVAAGLNALVLGQGVVGISAAQLLKLRGAKVIVADPSSGRLDKARKFADHTINVSTEDVAERVRDYTEGQMADIVFEASGCAAAASQAIALSARDARIQFQAAYTDPVTFEDFIWFSHSDRVFTGSPGTRYKYKSAALELIRTGQFDAKSLISEIRHIDDAPQAYQDVRNKIDEILKLLFRWE